MAARRAVGAGEPAARARVHDAKVALGERGQPWWEAPTPSAHRARLVATMRTLARHRAPAGTTCPSDVARAAGGSGWRSSMDEVRATARELAASGHLRIEQGGRPIDPGSSWRGPVRLRWVDDRTPAPGSRAT